MGTPFYIWKTSEQTWDKLKKNLRRYGDIKREFSFRSIFRPKEHENGLLA